MPSMQANHVSHGNRHEFPFYSVVLTIYALFLVQSYQRKDVRKNCSVPFSFIVASVQLFSAQQWTFAVAILTMILSFAKLLHAVLTPIPANAYNTNSDTDTDVENDTRYSSKSEAEFMKWRYSPSVNSGGPAIYFLLGILLFIGENNKRPVLLTIWLVAQCLGSCLVLLVFGFFVYILIVKDVAGESGLKHYAPVYILISVFALLTLQLFSVWVVKTYRRELLDANDFYTDNGDGIGDRRSSNVDRIYPFLPNNNNSQA